MLAKIATSEVVDEVKQAAPSHKSSGKAGAAAREKTDSRGALCNCQEGSSGEMEMSNIYSDKKNHPIEYIPMPQSLPPIEESYIFPRIDEAPTLGNGDAESKKLLKEGENGVSKKQRPSYSIV